MTRTQRLTLAVLLFAAAPLSAGETFTADGLLRHYAVARAPAPIVVDGHLDEFAWEGAEQINDFERILNDYDQILHPTRAKMLWDEQYFYFAFACQDADMWAIYSGEDDPLWEEEVVEVFIDPDGDGENYLELEVNPLNAVVDLKIQTIEPEWNSSIDWDIEGLQTAVQVHGTPNDSAAADLGWSVEIALPWAAMAGHIDGGQRPAPGDTWRLNLYRIERRAGRNLKLKINELQKKTAPLRAAADSLRAGRDEGQLQGRERREWNRLQEQMEPLLDELASLREHFHEQTEYSAWSETYRRGFHHPARFGVVQFAD